ncbi:hypothetical protein BC834DRAFT_972791 [Gloeopeniophorella convolvens]|nr:hypothetical protein BC834DRAFT_972791 [Gloeopeniophorella convolvens]
MSTPTSSLPPLVPGALPPVPPNIAEGTAPILLGTLFNWCMYGILLVQVYLYSYYFPDDKRAIKFLVYSVFILETVQTALTAADIFYWFADGFGNVIRLDNPYISFVDVPIIASFVSFVIQSFFAYRIWVLEKSLWWLIVAIEGISASQAIAGIVGGVKGHIYGHFSKSHRAIAYVYVWLIGDAVADVLIAVSMTYLLLRSRKQEYQFSSNSILAKIVRLTIETNAASATVAIVALVMFVGWPHHNYFYCPTAVLGKIYSNTLLVTFNNRISFRHGTHVRNPSSHDTTLADSQPVARFAPPRVSGTLQRSMDQFESLPKAESAIRLDYADTRRQQVVHIGYTDAPSPPVQPAQLHYSEVSSSPGSSDFSPRPLPSPPSVPRTYS